MKIKLNMQDVKRARILTPADVFELIKKIEGLDYQQENFVALFLNSQNKIISVDVLFIGGINQCNVFPQVLFRKALQHNAASIIITHNHPGGSLEPSNQDIQLVKKLKQGAELIGVQILDTIIFSEALYRSFNDEVDL